MPAPVHAPTLPHAAPVGQTGLVWRRPFTVLPRRWVVERTFGWLGRCRRLAKDYERAPLMGESFIYLAMIKLMARRLTSTA